MMPPSIARTFTPHRCPRCGQTPPGYDRQRGFGWRMVGWRVRLAARHADLVGGARGLETIDAFSRTLRAIGLAEQARLAKRAAAQDPVGSTR